VRIEQVSFGGHACVRLDDGSGAVTVTTSAGPRVLSLERGQGNLLAVLPDASIERPDGRRYRFLGGHRLWAAPEDLDVSYQPDDRPCAVVELEDGIRVEAPVDGAGLAKAITVRADGRGWSVDHELRNEAPAARTMAAWAITQLRPGGEAALPLPRSDWALLPDRSLVLWPYTDLGDERLAFGADGVRIRAEPGAERIKVGAAPGNGSATYRLGTELFEKRTDLDLDGSYADRGAAVQVYVCDEFCELETLGPLREVEPGGSISHTERWTVLAIVLP
jgi:hypothetical protein